MGQVIRRSLAIGLDRFRKRGRPTVSWMVRLTAAAVASYVVASLVFPRSDPLLAPLTALLVVQLTPVSLLLSGIDRVVSVVLGVSLAVGFSSVVGITWWSLGTVIALSLLIGRVLRLGSNLLEVPISAMLVLGVGARTAEPAAWQRIAETLVGAGVGVLANLVLPPKVTHADAANAIEGFADDLADLLDAASADLSPGNLGERAWQWLTDARRITHDIPNVGTALLRSEESRRLNLRALGTADAGPGLRHGLEALEHSALALRNMFRSVVDTSEGLDAQGRQLPDDVRAGVATLWRDLAEAIRAFGRQVRATPKAGDVDSRLDELRDALRRLQRDRDELANLLLIDPRADDTLSALTLGLLTTVERVLRELDRDERVRRLTHQPPTRQHRVASVARARRARSQRARDSRPRRESPEPGSGHT